MSYIGVQPFGQTVRTVTTITATASQTTFSPNGGYTVGYCDVYYNGIKLVEGQDYNASNGTTVVLTTGATANAVVDIVTYGTVTITDAVRRSGDTFAGAVAINSTLAAGNTTITGFANVTSNIQGGGSLTITGAASGITTLAAGNTTITGFANVTQGLTANTITSLTNTATFGTSLYAVSNGNVGFGVSNPTTKIMIGYSNANAANKIALGGSTGYQGFLDYNSGNEVFTIENTSDYSGGAIAFNVNAAERMRIDINGRVTIPYQPSFWAYLSGPQTVSPGNQLIAFNATRWDVGSNFNTSTNRFTAPVTGKYLFAASVGTGGSSGTQNYFGVQFYLNGTQYVVSGWNRQEVGGYLVDSKTTLLSLNAGDYVTVIVESQNGFNTNYTVTGPYFTGNLIG